MVADHVVKRRTNMLALARKIPGLSNTAELVSRAEAHVCRLLLELHQRGPIPEDHFSWLIDQYIVRSIEAQHPHLAGRAFEVLGPVPSTRTDLGFPASAVWDRYEAKHKGQDAAARGPRNRSGTSSSGEEAAEAVEKAANGRGH